MLENINFQYRNLISVLFCKHERIKLKIKSSPENRYFFSVSNKALLGPNWGQLVDFRFSFGFLHHFSTASASSIMVDSRLEERGIDAAVSQRLRSGKFADRSLSRVAMGGKVFVLKGTSSIQVYFRYVQSFYFCFRMVRVLRPRR